MNLLDLPNVMLIQIFEHLSYEEVAKCRAVCRKIDGICQVVLDCGFHKVVRQHAISFKRIKAMLPRRESERRNHCLARHADILTSIETRISMLSMTYCKYMDLNVCCFIPGRVLDEINRILRLVNQTQKPLRPHEVLQELRDISSMAIEHFDEKIASTLKKNYTETLQQYSRSGFPSPTSTQNLWSSASTSNSTELSCDSIRQKVNTFLNLGHIGIPDGLTKLGSIVSSNDAPTTTSAATEELRGCPEARAAMCYLKKLDTEYKKSRNKVSRLRYDLTCQTRRLTQSNNLIAELKSQIDDLKKRVDEVDAKNRELADNLKHLKSGEVTDASGVGINSSRSMEIEAVSGTTSPVPLEIQSASSTTEPAASSDIITTANCPNEAVKITLKRSTRKRRGDTNDAMYTSTSTSSSSSHNTNNFNPSKKKSEWYCGVKKQ